MKASGSLGHGSPRIQDKSQRYKDSFSTTPRTIRDDRGTFPFPSVSTCLSHKEEWTLAHIPKTQLTIHVLKITLAD